MKRLAIVIALALGAAGTYAEDVADASSRSASSATSSEAASAAETSSRLGGSGSSRDVGDMMVQRSDERSSAPARNDEDDYYHRPVE